MAALKITSSADATPLNGRNGKCGSAAPSSPAELIRPNRAPPPLARRTTGCPQADKGWVSEVMAAERKRQEELEADAATDSEGFVNPQRFGKEVGEFFGRDAIVAVDGGDIVSTTARWLQVSTAGQVLDPGLSAPSAPVLRSPSRPKSCSRTSWLGSSSEWRLWLQRLRVRHVCASRSSHRRGHGATTGCGGTSKPSTR
jgi:hypothetical protein